MDKLYIAEDIFYGLQGEGIRMGFPSVFIRLGGCNLRCEGFDCWTKSPLDDSLVKGCDTIFAANTIHFKHTWNEFISFQEIVNKIVEVVPKEMIYNEDRVDLIITGGEPILHYKNPILISLIQYAISRGHKVFIETNGTLPIDFNKYPIYKRVHFSISTKMETSGEKKSKRWKPEVVNNYLANTNGSYFKFVLSKKNLIKDASEIFQFLNLVSTYATVYCMPMGETRNTLEENAKSVYEFALVNGFRYSDRLHIRIYNDKVGV